jgi:LPS O-antigen subunit length determinant protein (WzzB/FepE family)
MIFNKQNEISQLEAQSLSLQIQKSKVIDDSRLKLARTKEKLDSWQLAAQPPYTQEAVFVLPVYSPDTRVSPQRTIIVLISVMFGGFLGVISIFLSRIKTQLKQQRIAREVKHKIAKM